MADFCLNALCLRYNKDSERMTIQNLLDDTLFFLTDTWKRHKKLNQRDLRLYIDVNPNRKGLLDYKDYYTELGKRAKTGFSKLRNMLMALSRMQVYAPFYDDPTYSDKSLENLCGKRICIVYDESRCANLQISDCDSDATFFYFAFQRQMFLLCLANQKFWEHEKIDFLIFEENGSFSRESIENVCLHNGNGNDVEKKFFPMSVQDEGYFEKTGHKSQGQEIYQELSTDNYWCLDGLHGDHFEVYSANYQHLGEADAQTYVLNRKKAVPGRNIKSEFS